jgi:CRP-like cAMP-binding protein
MTDSSNAIDVRLLRRLVPVSELTQDNLRELAGKTRLERLPAGRRLFKKDDQDNLSFYLLSGEVVLNDGNQSRTIAANSAAARYPLDHHRPRQATATAATDIEFVRIDNDLLDILLTWDQNAGYMVTEISDEGATSSDGDWMTDLLASSVFHRIPATNIQAIFMRMEPMPVRTGDVVIRQGEEGDYYYYLKEGRAVVTRTSSKTDKLIKLAEIEAGTGFGEEALISGAKRNADVKMLTAQAAGTAFRHL